ncbi:MAG: PRC-barrel domain-containing protein [Endomicrobium sp.]|jgi:16S rRNA processing protein RimM|nr:PRC-barrel domain-containing protein [Endomicrobium sp.]
MEYKKNDLNLKWKVSDILGFEVFNQHGTRLGIFSDIILTGSNDVWVVKDYNEEVLIPALKDIIKEVNIVRKKIFVVLPKGYEDIYGHVKSADDILEYNGYFVYED